MFAFPVITRELRAQARKPGTYYARFWWGLLALVCFGFVVTVVPNKSTDGRFLLSTVHAFLAVILLLVSPAAAADALSREKREGTLGLLLLTRLTALKVVLAKFSAHGISLFYFFFILAPLLALPMLAGGVGPREFLLSTSILLALLVSSLSAAMIASAYSKRFGNAVSAAYALSILLSWFCMSASFATLNLFFTSPLGLTLDWFERWGLMGPVIGLSPTQIAPTLQTIFPSPLLLPALMAASLSISVLIFFIALGLCTSRVARHGETGAETKRQLAFRKRFLTPVLAKEGFRRLMRVRMERNPLIWLEYRAAWARAFRTAMILLFAGFETLWFVRWGGNEFFEMQIPALSVIGTLVIFKSCHSFQLEKESGAFELILVTPFQGSVASSRLKAVHAYYRPVLVCFVIFLILEIRAINRLGIYFAMPQDVILLLFSLFLTLVSAPATGLFFALRFKSALVALTCTFALAGIVPLFFWPAIEGVILKLARSLHWVNLSMLVLLLRDATLLKVSVLAAYHLFLSTACQRGAKRLLATRRYLTGS